jgi:hypothetical protein
MVIADMKHCNHDLKGARRIGLNVEFKMQFDLSVVPNLKPIKRFFCYFIGSHATAFS